MSSTIRTVGELNLATYHAVLQIRRRFNQAQRNLNLPVTSLADRSPFEQEERKS